MPWASAGFPVRPGRRPPASLPAHLREGRIIYGFTMPWRTTPVPAGERGDRHRHPGVTAKETEQAAPWPSILKGFLLHLGYPGRITTAGNLAFPLSPGEFSPETDDDTHTTLVVAGSREPLFIDQTDTLFAMVRNLAPNGPIRNSPPPARPSPGPLTRKPAHARGHHRRYRRGSDSAAMDRPWRSLRPYRAKGRFFPPCNVPMGETSVWSVYHLWDDQAAIEAPRCFLSRLYSVSGRDLDAEQGVQPRYAPLGTPAPGPLDERPSTSSRTDRLPASRAQQAPCARWSRCCAPRTRGQSTHHLRHLLQDPRGLCPGPWPRVSFTKRPWPPGWESRGGPCSARTGLMPATPSRSPRSGP